MCFRSVDIRLSLPLSFSFSFSPLYLSSLSLSLSLSPLYLLLLLLLLYLSLSISFLSLCIYPAVYLAIYLSLSLSLFPTNTPFPLKRKKPTELNMFWLGLYLDGVGGGGFFCVRMIKEYELKHNKIIIVDKTIQMLDSNNNYFIIFLANLFFRC